MSAYADDIIAAIREISDTAAGMELTPRTRFEGDLAFDSGNFIELFLILEETIPGFTLGSARLVPEDFHTIERLGAFIVRRLAELEVAA